jgi:hypothetical protein
VHAAAESQVVAWVPGHVELVGPLVAAFVAVGRSDEDQHPTVSWHVHAADLGGLGDQVGVSLDR